MKILFTNDDGYDSVLLQDLFEYVGSKFPTIERLLLAPAENCSGISHAITLDKSMIYREKEQNRYIVEGYPVDCVMVAYGIFGELDLVISGPNYGSNLGQDIIYSGTVGAAREAALHNIPALALSFVDDNKNLNHINYDYWHIFLDRWLDGLMKLAQNNRGSIVNVNISSPISLDLFEGTLGSRYYFNYQSMTKGSDGTGKYYAAILKEGIDHTKVELESDVGYMLKGKNVFSVFSAWPKIKSTKLNELKQYLEK